MAYRLKHHTDLHWFDLDKLEHPDLASAIIQRLQGPSYQGQSPDELIKGFSKVFPLGFDEHALNTLLQTGDYFLIAEGDAQQPLLRDGNKISFYIDEDGKSQQQTEQEWQFTSTSYAEHLSASLRFAIMQTPKPIFSVAARQNAKPEQAQQQEQKQEKKKEPEKFWLKIQSIYDDPWQTPLPVSVQISVNDAIHQQGVALNTGAGKNTKASNLKAAQKTAQEPGTVLLEDIPEGHVEVVVERQTGLEKEIADLKKQLRVRLDGGYRALIKDMAPFQQDWDEYGYASIVVSGAGGLWDGSSSWLEDQAELFDADTWKQIGDSISDGLSDIWSYTADYVPEAYDELSKTIEDTVNTLDDNKENLVSWNWWQQQAEDTVDKAVKKVEEDIEDAKDFIVGGAKTLEKLFKHKGSILKLPQKISEGDVVSVQRFVDTVLMDLDPELAKQIKESPDFHMVLELIADHDAALTYFAYLDLFIEAVPPNFYAYVGGKGSAYIAIEVILLIALSFLTLGAGTAAKAASLSAKFLVTSTRVVRVLDKAEKAQQAFKSVIDDFIDSADNLQKLGDKLSKTRSAGRVETGVENSTLTAKKETIKRNKNCRYCNSTKHNTPNKKMGYLYYR